MQRLATWVLLVGVFIAAGADWPAFRGPTGMGVSGERGLPVKWGPQENVVWKTKLPGPGASSPVTWGDRVFVTCYSGYGEARVRKGDKGDKGDQSNLRRHLLCLDRHKGEILWQKDIAAQLPEANYATQVNQHGFATSTPVTDGERVYVFFGRTGAFAFDFTGKQLWHTELGKATNTFGTGASPALYRNLLLVNASVESGAFAALDKATGKIIWRVKGLGDCWSTPLVLDVPGGKPELVLNAPAALQAYDPDTGQELWGCDTLTSVYASVTPVVRNGIVYVMSSGSEGRLFQAMRAGGKGDVTKTHVVWTQKIGASYGSPLLAGDHLYFLSAFFFCLRADTGQVVFQERLPGLGVEYGSPVLADGKIYAFTRSGNAFVLAATDRFELLAQNKLGDTDSFVASPAVSGGRLYVRTNEYLYCLGQK